MSEYRDLSRLPDDDAYWAELASRITGELSPRIRAGVTADAAPTHARDALPASVAGWWAPLERRAWRLAGLAVAAGLAAVLLLPRDPSPDIGETGRVATLSGAAALVPPSDRELAVPLSAPLAAAVPPALATLVVPGGGSAR